MSSAELHLDVLGANDRVAGENRAWLAARGIVALNLMSGPGAGKTTLIERTLATLQAPPLAVIVGDQATERDAERIRAAGGRAVQVNTGAGCHLDAGMVRRALDELGPERGSVLLIENVGNLVCPAPFDLGESARVVLMSVTEGDDKPSKYPHLFRTADLVLLTKIDLLPHVTFDVGACAERARALAPRAEIVGLCAPDGVGMDLWRGWLRGRRQAALGGR